MFLLFQFVELKGSVFKKFDKNNLFQVSCSDVRERFHLFSLLFIVVVQTMKEYGWKEGKKLFLDALVCTCIFFRKLDLSIFIYSSVVMNE